MTRDERSLNRYKWPSYCIHYIGGRERDENWQPEISGDGPLDVMRHLPPDVYHNILNLGGSWQEAMEYQAMGYDCTTVCLADGHVADLEEDGFKYIRNDMTDMIDVENQSVDAVVTIQSLEHVFYPWKALLEIYRVVKDGGRVMIDVPVWHQSKSQTPPPHEMCNLDHCAILEPHQMRCMVLNCGFEIIIHDIAQNRQTLYLNKLSLDQIKNYPKQGKYNRVYTHILHRFLKGYCDI